MNGPAETTCKYLPDEEEVNKERNGPRFFLVVRAGNFMTSDLAVCRWNLHGIFEWPPDVHCPLKI